MVKLLREENEEGLRDKEETVGTGPVRPCLEYLLENRVLEILCALGLADVSWAFWFLCRVESAGRPRGGRGEEAAGRPRAAKSAPGAPGAPALFAALLSSLALDVKL